LDKKSEEVHKAKQTMEKQTREFSNIQHNMSVISGKEDNYQRRLYEREQEIKELKRELQETRQNLQEQTEIANIKANEAAELLEDIQTLTRENKYVNQEFGKTTQTADHYRKANEELANRERHAQQQLRAVELEKEDILKTYRNTCSENERLVSNLDQMANENRDLY